MDSQYSCFETKQPRSRSRLLPHTLNQAALSCLQTGAAVHNRQIKNKEISKLKRGIVRGDTFSADVCLCCHLAFLFVCFFTFQSVGGINHILRPSRWKFVKILRHTFTPMLPKMSQHCWER